MFVRAERPSLRRGRSTTRRGRQGPRAGDRSGNEGGGGGVQTHRKDCTDGVSIVLVPVCDDEDDGWGVPYAGVASQGSKKGGTVVFGEAIKIETLGCRVYTICCIG